MSRAPYVPRRKSRGLKKYIENERKREVFPENKNSPVALIYDDLSVYEKKETGEGEEKALPPLEKDFTCEDSGSNSPVAPGEMPGERKKDQGSASAPTAPEENSGVKKRKYVETSLMDVFLGSKPEPNVRTFDVRLLLIKFKANVGLGTVRQAMNKMCEFDFAVVNVGFYKSYLAISVRTRFSSKLMSNLLTFNKNHFLEGRMDNRKAISVLRSIADKEKITKEYSESLKKIEGMVANGSYQREIHYNVEEINQSLISKFTKNLINKVSSKYLFLFNILYINIGGLSTPKLLDILTQGTSYNISYIVVAETWVEYLSENYKRIIRVKGYSVLNFKPATSVVNAFRKQKGILLLKKNDCQLKELSSIYSQGIILEIENYKVVFIYRSASDEFDVKSLRKIFEDKERKNILMGDLNIERNFYYNLNIRSCIKEIGLIYKVDLKECTHVKGEYHTSPDEVHTNCVGLDGLVLKSAYEHQYIGVSLDITKNEVILENLENVNQNKVHFTRMRVKEILNKEKDNWVKTLKESYSKHKNINESIIKSYENFCSSKKAKKDLKKRNKSISEILKDIKGKKLQVNCIRTTLISKIAEEYISNSLKIKPTIAHVDKENIYSFIKENFLKSNFNRTVIRKVKYRKFSIKEIKKAVLNLPKGKARDAYGICNEMLQIDSNEYFKLLQKVIKENISLNCRLMKEVRLVTIPKGNNNLRRICISSAFKSIIDQMIYRRLIKFAKKHKVLTKQQIGFTEKASTFDNVFYLEDKIRRSDKNFICLFLDLKKAYNNVERTLLYRKLEKYKLPEELIHLIKISLEDNFIIHNEEKFEIERGLPQGNKIARILFNFFVNDIVEKFFPQDRKDIILYADDIVLFTENTMRMQRHIKVVEKYFEENKIEINTKKSIILCSSQYDNTEFRINGNIITKKETLKYLGIYFSKGGIDVRKNILELKKIVLLKTHRLRKIFQDQHTSLVGRNLMIKKFVMGHLYFIWPVVCASKEGSLQAKRLNNTIFRIIFGLHRRFPTRWIEALFTSENIEKKVHSLSKNFINRVRNNKRSNIYNLCKKKAVKKLEKIKNLSNTQSTKFLNRIKSTQERIFKRTFRTLKDNQKDNIFIQTMIENINQKLKSKYNDP